MSKPPLDEFLASSSRPTCGSTSFSLVDVTLELGVFGRVLISSPYLVNECKSVEPWYQTAYNAKPFSREDLEVPFCPLPYVKITQSLLTISGRLGRNPQISLFAFPIATPSFLRLWRL